MIGQTLGHYEIVEKLGAGGMGEVYRARDTRLERDVAIKVLPVAALSDEAARARFRKEALALARLNHPHIGMVFDFNTQEGVDFLVMELVSGESLAEKFRAGPLAEKDIAALGAQVASALEEAHERGIIHRDLKPGNILVTPKGQAKVLDFGLARLLRSDAEADVTASLSEPHAVAGTVPYMAPEQLRGQPADARADIWALGVVLYEMAAGARPFQGETGFALSAAIINQSPPPLPSRVPAWLRGIIERCLEKDPGRRYQRAGEVRAALEALQTGTVSPWDGWQYQFTRRRGLVTAAAIALLAVAALGLDLGGLRSRLTATSSALRIESLAVLPLENLSGDAEQDYLADGMTEALITDLARLGGLMRVTARGSVMRYKGTTRPLAEIARELKVDALITGSVLRSSDRVSVTAQLIDPRTGNQLWANRYERELADVLALQNEIVSSVLGEIKLKLSAGERARLASARTVNPEAYEAYLKGRFYWNKRTEEDFKTAIVHFNQAIELDPTYAPAYAGLADSYGLLGTYEVLPPREAYSRAKSAALKALEFDDALPEAHASLAWTKFRYDWDWPGAEREFKRAIELNPNYATAHHWYARFLASMGRLDQAATEAQRAHELEPLSPIINTVVGEVYIFSRQYDRAIRQLESALEIDRDFAYGLNKLAHAYALNGQYQQAIAAAQRASSLPGARPWFLAELGYIYGLAGRKGEALGVLDELKKLSERRYVSAYIIAQVYVGLGEAQHAHDWLEKAFEERSSLLTEFRDPLFDGVRDHPPFRDLLRRMNLPP